MRIIIPPHNIKASPVASWSEIKNEAKELMGFLDARSFEGKWKDAFAISHAQVSEKPKTFFVLNKNVAPIFNKARIIINAKIISGENKVKNKEGCMGYPFEKAKLVKRYFNITAEFFVPGLFGRLQRKEIALEDLPAFIVQHEVDHAEGKDIYQRSDNKPKKK